MKRGHTRDRMVTGVHMRARDDREQNRTEQNRTETSEGVNAFVAVATFIVRFGLSKHLEAIGVPVVGEAANAGSAHRQ